MVGIKIGAKVGEKGQVVIPKPIREQFHIHSDTELVFDVEDEKIILQKKKSGLDVLEDFVNAVKSKKKFPENVDWDKEHYSQFE
jgi:AbrB family looped-hinge helix DNA binding protein